MLKLSDASKEELSQYSKNYLPILFNLYTAEDNEGDADKLAILETIRVYLSITDHKVSNLPSMLLYLPSRITREDKTKFVFLVIKKKLRVTLALSMRWIEKEKTNSLIANWPKSKRNHATRRLGRLLKQGLIWAVVFNNQWSSNFPHK